MTKCLFKQVIVLCIYVAMLAGCAPEQDSSQNMFYDVVNEATYVGSESCASCHENEYQGYQSHGMANSFYRFTEARVVEDFSGVVIEHSESGYFYQALHRGSQYYQEEFRLDSRGRKTHSLLRSIDYVIGSGTAARTYLTENEGRLYQLPLTWYTQANRGEGKWDFSPGYEEHNARFNRAIPPRCMACHNGISTPVEFEEGLFTSLGSGIDCEQCHGPGSIHVDARLANSESGGEIDSTIVNPAHLPLDLRLDVCQQCHTNGAVSILREGRSAYSFRPSEPLSRHVAIFAKKDETPGTISVISHAERMQQSECFAQSIDMDCTTCHNPHEGFREAGPEYFNKTCIGCHSTNDLQQNLAGSVVLDDHNSSSNCFSCHMPAVEAEDAPHSSFTDHYIRVVEDQGQAGSVDPSNELKPYFEVDQSGEEADMYLGMAYVAFGRNQAGVDVMRRGVDFLSSSMTERPEHGEAQFLLGYAHLQLGNPRAAIGPLESAISVDRNVPERLNALAQAYEQTNTRRSEIESLYREALRIQPESASIRVNLGKFLEAQNRFEEALEQYQMAIESEPYLASAHYNYGTLQLRLANSSQGQESLGHAVQLDPDNADALTNLGVLQAANGDIAGALPFFERAVQADSLNANAHANFALGLVETGQIERAGRHARTALELQPNNSTAMQVLSALEGQ